MTIPDTGTIYQHRYSTRGRVNILIVEHTVMQ